MKISRAHIALLMFVFICLSFGGISQVAGEKVAGQTHFDRDSNKARVLDTYGRLPLSFEANQGQTNRKVKFLSRGASYTLFLTPTEAVLSLKTGQRPHIDKPSGVRVSSRSKGAISKAAILRIHPEHANGSAKVIGFDDLAGKSNYFIGNDSAKWRRDVPTFGRVKYQDVYPGVDLIYYGNQRQLEYDFVLAPGADPRQIELSFAGAERLRLDRDGDLFVTIAGRQIVEHVPLIYQNIKGVRRRVSGGYELKSGHTVGFKVAAYDRRERLTIDPKLEYSTYLGGSDNDVSEGIAVDSSGSAYVTGSTFSIDFPTTAGALQTIFSGGRFDAFVSKLNSNGSALVYSTYLGGNGADNSSGIAVDCSENAYVTGSTDSKDFPVTTGALQSNFGGGLSDGFVTKLDRTGSALIYSTYLGGAGEDSGAKMAVDSSGSVFVTGRTFSTDFPTTAGALQTTLRGDLDAFVSKLNSSGSALIYSTYLGGSGDDFASGVAVDSAGDAYVIGGTSSTDFPTTTGALQTSIGGDLDAFVSKLNRGGSSLVYSTYLGGSAGDSGFGIAIDLSGNAYVTGSTFSGNFPTTSKALQTTFGGSEDTYVSKLNSSGSALIYSTYLGGSDNDFGEEIAIDSLGDAYVTGSTLSSDFPITEGALQTTFGGGGDAFVSKLNRSGSALLYSSFLGGSESDQGNAITIDQSKKVYVTGFTSSSDFPTSTRGLQTILAGGIDAFVSEFTFCTQPRTKRDCKDGGWLRFCGPSFKNQGQCVAFVNHHTHHDRNHEDDEHARGMI